jgi:phosphonate transport system permease protein
MAVIGFMFPPDWSALGEMIQPAFQSIVIALLGTVFGSLLSVIFALLAASNLFNKWVRNITRFFIGLERSLPEIIQLLLLIAAFDFGPVAGIIALALGCIGMLGKLLADAIEELDPVMLESMESVGANKLQVIVFCVLPQIMPNLISYALFRLEINIRLSVILGAVGAGGIGYELEYSFGMLQYHRALTALLVIIAMIFGMEHLSELLRNKIKMEGALK